MPWVRILLLLLQLWQHTASETEPAETADGELLIVGELGFVESPKFPRSYPRDITLRWTLRPLRGILTLTFDELFGLEEPENGICKYDYVQLEEWVGGEQKLLGRWCGRSGGGRLESRGAEVVVLFHSDSYFPSSPGFRLHYAILEVLETTTVFKDLAVSQVSLADSSPITLEELEGALSEVHSLEDLLFFLQPRNPHQQLLASYEQPADGQESQSPPRRGRAGMLLLSNTAKLMNGAHEDARRFTCTPHNTTVVLRNELQLSHVVFWPPCVLVPRCVGVCSCCGGGDGKSSPWRHSSLASRGTCSKARCSCEPVQVVLKNHQVVQIWLRSSRSHGHPWGSRRPAIQKSLKKVPLAHHEACRCSCEPRDLG
uniref:platelet-derived growth factor C-like n=1 Tax=Myxine glutinosa TaxID=7769 RepID=UPI00359026AD